MSETTSEAKRAQTEHRKKATAATVAARHRIIEAHKDEYDRIHMEERTKLGLTGLPHSSGKLSTEEKIRRAEERLAKLREELNS